MALSRRQLGLLVFAAASTAIIIIAGGGLAFLERPVGTVYSGLWFVWWVAMTLGRPEGVRSRYDRRQRFLIAGSGVTVVPLLIVGPPWEYAHLLGPLPRDGLLSWAGLITMAGGIGLHSWAMVALHGLYTSRLGRQPGHRLITDGPYQLVRHPGYLSNVVILFGMGLAMSSLIGLGLAIIVVPLIVWRVEREEEMLLAEFGDEYRAYMQRTRRLIPFMHWR